MFCRSLCCPFVIFFFAITLSVLRFTASAYPFGIFKVSLFPYDYVIHVYSCDKEHVLRTSRLYKFIYEQSDPIFEGLGRYRINNKHKHLYNKMIHMFIYDESETMLKILGVIELINTLTW